MSFKQGITAKPRPRITPDHQPLWDGFKVHKLMLPYCEECGKPHLPPGPVCPYCLSDRLDWREASGCGTISTWVEVHKVWFPAFADDVPYNVIQVELAEGPRITANLIDFGGKIEVGQKVQATFDDVDEDLTMLRFKPA
ncbi:Zn-ribbon domain-containing OB-fold protein [Chelativorans sp. J32]|uniref:Zn-ribbon domain-containing OB-fold protein n=1 Tax=Chelativorans sp. J32 TaxID=935840 RepID=UPI0004AE337B|nr:OB-fold domain-containing protein [Chelativorans sp. J32]